MLKQKLQQQSTSIDLVRNYLLEIGRVPLLTREQEIVYGKQVQQMMSLLCAKEALLKKLHRSPTLSEWASHVQMSESELNEALQKGQRAGQKMVEANLRLVVAIAKKYQKRGIEFLDLVQEGTMGLARGVEKFDPMRGYKFSTYAYWWIRQAITRAIATTGRTIRLPIHITERLNKIKKAQRQLSQKLGEEKLGKNWTAFLKDPNTHPRAHMKAVQFFLVPCYGRTPTTKEIATELKLTQEQVLLCIERSRLPMSLDLLVGDERDTERRRAVRGHRCNA